MASRLLDAGADPSAVDVLRITPLMAAASCVNRARALEVIGTSFNICILTADLDIFSYVHFLTSGFVHFAL